MAQRGAATLAEPGSNGAARNVSAGTVRRGRPQRVRRLPSTNRVRLPELVLGVLLVAGGALGAVLWATRESTQRVLVAARPIERGETLDGTMVRWVQLQGDRIEGIEDPAGLGGRIADVDIASGSPLQESSFRAPTSIGADQVEYGLALDPGDFPVGLAVGDDVLIVVVPHPDETGTALEPITLATPAEVMVAPAVDLAPGAKAVVNLLVARGDVAALAGAADVRIGRVDAESGVGNGIVASEERTSTAEPSAADGDPTEEGP